MTTALRPEMYFCLHIGDQIAGLERRRGGQISSRFEESYGYLQEAMWR